MLILILVHFIDNLRHTLVFLMVITIENAHARQTSSELGLLSLNRVFHGPRFIRPATSGGRFPLNFSDLIASASKVQGERNRINSNCRAAALTRTAFCLKMLCKGTKKIDKFQVFFQFVFK
jgi:hypothetical protein